MNPSLPTTYFDTLYERSPDPWSFETSPYERAKYTATLSALPHQRYARALELGCSIGMLTERLASRCDELIAMEPAAAALERARQRCRDLAHVTFLQARTPAAWPPGTFDLILLSEMVYYLSPPDVVHLAARVAASIRPGAHVELVHWVRETDYPLSGDDAAELYIAATVGTLAPITQHRTEDYRLDLLAAM